MIALMYERVLYEIMLYIMIARTGDHIISSFGAHVSGIDL